MFPKWFATPCALECKKLISNVQPFVARRISFFKVCYNYTFARCCHVPEFCSIFLIILVNNLKFTQICLAFLISSKKALKVHTPQ